MQRLNIFSLFSGLGAFERALENLDIEYNLVNYCEIDKYASKAYAILHCNGDESKNLWDVTKITEEMCANVPHINLLTYGFPCQDISLAGMQRGLKNEDGTATRSGLVWNAHDVIRYTMPDVALCENVKNLTSKKFAAEFQAILKNLEDIGYNNYWKVLNAKDYGVPQNRERVFIVSIRKDVDDGSFKFPEGFPLVTRLKDILLPNVDEKYFIKDEKAIPFIEKYVENNADKVIGIGNVNSSGAGQNGKVIDSQGIARTVTVEKGEGQKVVTSAAMRGRTTTHGSVEQQIEISNREFSNAITTVQKDSLVTVEGRLNSSQDGVVVSADGVAPTHTGGMAIVPRH